MIIVISTPRITGRVYAQYLLRYLPVQSVVKSIYKELYNSANSNERIWKSATLPPSGVHEEVTVKQGQVALVFSTRGGKRRGAGRKPKGPRASERHETRPEHNPRHPVHVTLRVVGSVGGLRCRDLYLALREATIATGKREDFRIVHMSIQRDHLHLIVEADSKAALSTGMQGFSISAARQINKAITARDGDRRTGKVIADRFHARPLTSPRAVRNTVAYVLLNWRRHGEDRTAVARTWRVDPFSSGPVFAGWKELSNAPVMWPLRPTYQPLIVWRPRTWLLRCWDQLHPPISLEEVPGRRSLSASSSGVPSGQLLVPSA
jgi:REP element-mobilizing transposase RayT